MKLLKIGDISKAYDIGIDSLRYYEKKGLINPTRLDNGYRHYSYNDLWKLNIIKELRMLDFPLKNIELYLNNRTTKSTTDLLLDEIEKVDQQIKKLSSLKKMLHKKIDVIYNYSNMTYNDIISIKHITERKCIILMENVDAPTEIDFFFRKLQLKAHETIPLIGYKELCVFMPVNQLEEVNFYSKVFSFFHIEGSHFVDYNFTLPTAQYLTITYKGAHDLSRDYAMMLIKFAEDKDYELITDPFEICHIDIHETNKPEEFVTEIQLAVKSKTES